MFHVFQQKLKLLSREAKLGIQSVSYVGRTSTWDNLPGILVTLNLLLVPILLSITFRDVSLKN